jgi:squalene synthase HpnC
LTEGTSSFKMDQLTTEAYNHCRRITKSHYENFPVASLLIPIRLRKHVYAIYAFARHADDLSDEKQDKEGLLRWKAMLHESVNGKAEHPIYIALSDTIKKFDLPVNLFDKLISAFQQDLQKNRYDNFDELFAYCENSANPVGRLVLLLNGYRDDELFQYSDYICTALQLTNFWQDVKVDIQKDRIYIPKDLQIQYEVNEGQIERAIFNSNFRALMISLVEQTMDLFKKGYPLLRKVGGRLRWELRFTVEGGTAILNKIRGVDYDVLQSRPKLNKLDWAKIALNLLTHRNDMV